MRNIVIISKVIAGARSNSFGIDGTLNPFKKSFSKSLEEKLNNIFKDKGMDYLASVDRTYESISTILEEGASLVLISPYVKDTIILTDIEEDKYYVLSEKEYVEGHVDKLIAYLSK